MKNTTTVLEFPAEPDLEPVRKQPDGERAGATSEILPIYVQEMRSYERIDLAREMELGREIERARDSLVRIFLALPADRAGRLFEGSRKADSNGRRWSMKELDRNFQRLVAYAETHPGSTLRASVRRARRHRRRLESARRALMLANLRLVVHVAQQYNTRGVPLLDLIQEGNIGLLRASELYEYRRGHRFCTYAYPWIRQAVARAVVDKSRVIRVPVHVEERRKKVARASFLLETSGGVPTAEEIADKLDLSVPEVTRVLEIVRDPQSLDTSTGEGGSILPMLHDPNAPSPLLQVEQKELRDVVRRALAGLTPKESEIVRRRFGIGDHDPQTLGQIGETLDLSRERVRQLQAAAMRKLQEMDAMAEVLECHQHERPLSAMPGVSNGRVAGLQAGAA